MTEQSPFRTILSPASKLQFSPVEAKAKSNSVSPSDSAAASSTEGTSFRTTVWIALWSNSHLGSPLKISMPLQVMTSTSPSRVSVKNLRSSLLTFVPPALRMFSATSSWVASSPAAFFQSLGETYLSRISPLPLNSLSISSCVSTFFSARVQRKPMTAALERVS